MVNRVILVGCVLTFCLFATQCKLIRGSSKHVLITKDTLEFISEVKLHKEKFGLSLVEHDLTLYFDKSEVLKLFDLYLDTFQLRIDSGIYPNFNRRYYDKYYKMKQFIIERSNYNIIDISGVDSLKNLNYSERMKLIEENTELGFKIYSKEILCQLIESGDVSIIEGDKFLEKIIQVRYSQWDNSSGWSTIRFVTEAGKTICDCPPILRYN